MWSILDGYGVMTVFYARTRPRVNRSISWWVATFNQLQTGRSRYLDTWLVPKACGEMRGVGMYVLPARFTTERQPVLRSAVAFSKINFKHR
jgi:hypothetical protein